MDWKSFTNKVNREIRNRGYNKEDVCLSRMTQLAEGSIAITLEADNAEINLIIEDE